jgi:hypothetical protein
VHAFLIISIRNSCEIASQSSMPTSDTGINTPRKSMNTPRARDDHIVDNFPPVGVDGGDGEGDDHHRDDPGSPTVDSALGKSLRKKLEESTSPKTSPKAGSPKSADKVERRQEDIASPANSKPWPRSGR